MLYDNLRQQVAKFEQLTAEQAKISYKISIVARKLQSIHFSFHKRTFWWLGGRQFMFENPPLNDPRGVFPAIL